MEEVLLRSLMVVPVAVLLPLGLPSVPSALCRAATAALLVGLALATSAQHWQMWVIVVGAAASASLPIPNTRRPWVPVVAAVATLGLVVALTTPGLVLDRAGELVDDRRVIAVVAGGLACIFLGGALIGTLLHPLAEKMRHTEGTENAGRLIGWIERALLYGLVLVGAPSAAALVIAGKSVARFPSFREERFAEYYLIGSLLSLTIAFGAALGVRAIIGLEPVAPL